MVRDEWMSQLKQYILVSLFHKVFLNLVYAVDMHWFCVTCFWGTSGGMG